MSLKILAASLALIPSILSAPITQDSSSSLPTTPVVSTNNGSIQGTYLPTFNQDAYLGIPFAEPPLSSLRFLPPQSYNSSWTDVKSFDAYGYSCFASSGTDDANLEQSEDCLTLNVVKPHGYENMSLPVGIWIHGGGFTDGSGVRPAYNTSWVVQHSVEIGKPIIAVTINYRLNGFGFLSADQISQKGYTNIGLRDQIKAIEWVHENIEGFGGNPEHLVIWGESAGAISVGKLLSNTNYLGDYIKGGIMESGANIFTNILPAATANNEKDFQLLLNHFQCENATDYVECLQKIDSHELQIAFNTSNGVLTNGGFGFPYTDGDVVEKSSYSILESGEGFYKVPILIGTSTDEGSAFTNSTLNTTDQVKDYLRSSYPRLANSSIDTIVNAYSDVSNLENITPNDPTYNNTPIVYPSTLGQTYPWSATISGDLVFISGAKLTAKLYAKQGVPVFKYRFNIPTLETANRTFVGTTHYQEVVYVFDNQQHPTDGSDGTNVFPSAQGPKIANAVSKLWASFIHDLDPNIASEAASFQVDVPTWPDYKDTNENYVFDLQGFHIEKDTTRESQFEFYEKIAHQLDA